MSVPDGFNGLRSPCECVSFRGEAYSDPWAEITKNRLLPNGTKEQILNVLAAGPNTITQIAESLPLRVFILISPDSLMCIAAHVYSLRKADCFRLARNIQKALNGSLPLMF